MTSALAPFGTDSQPNTRAVLRAGKLVYLPSYSSQRNRTEEITSGYDGNVPFYPPSVRQEVDGRAPWARRSPLPPIIKNRTGLGPPSLSMRETERSEGAHYVEGAKWEPEKINNNIDMGQAIQIKRLLEGWPRENLKKVYVEIAEKYDAGLTDKAYRGALSEVFVSLRVPMTAKVLEKLFDRFALVRDPTNVDYKKLLIYLDTVFEVTNFEERSRLEKSSNKPLMYPLPAPSQEEKLENSELSKTFRAVEGRTTDRDRRRHELVGERRDHMIGDDYSKSELQPKEEDFRGAFHDSGYNNTGITSQYEPFIATQHQEHQDEHFEHINHNQQQQQRFTKAPSPINTKIDQHDAELLALLVSHLSKKGRNIDLKDIKKAFYDADQGKTNFISRGKVKDILRKHSVSLDDWLLDALINRCDIDNTDTQTCWIAVIEFLERVQPFTLTKAHPSANAVTSPSPQLRNNNNHRAEAAAYNENTMMTTTGGNYEQHLNDTSDAASFFDHNLKQLHPTSDPIEYQSRLNNLKRAIKSVDIDRSGLIGSDEALRLLRNYNTVYHLDINDTEMLRILTNSSSISHQGLINIDSLCENLTMEKGNQQQF